MPGLKSSRIWMTREAFCFWKPLIFSILVVSSGLSAQENAENDANSVEITGELDVVIRDNFKAGRSETVYYLTDELTGQRTRIFPVNPFQKPPPSGSRYVISGVQGSDGIVAHHMKPIDVAGVVKPKTHEMAAATATALVPETRSILTLLVDFNDATVDGPGLSQGVSVQDVKDALYNNDLSIAGQYFSASLGTFVFDPDADGDGQQDVFGPYQIDDSFIGGDYSQCTEDSWVDQAVSAWQAANPAKNIGIYQTLLLIMPNYQDWTNAHCDDWVGIASSCDVASAPDCWAISRDTRDDQGAISSHELGHTLGMEHSKTDPNNNGYSGIELPDKEYGDNSDNMGSPETWRMRFNAPHAESQGWFNPVDFELRTIIPVASPQQFELLSMDDEVDLWKGLRALRIPRNSEIDYFISYRLQAGDYNELPLEYAGKVSIHYRRNDPLWAGESNLVKTLSPGETFIDLEANLKVHAIGESTETADDGVTTTTSMAVEICQESCGSPTFSITSVPDRLFACTKSTTDILSPVDLEVLEITSKADPVNITFNPPLPLLEYFRQAVLFGDINPTAIVPNNPPASATIQLEARVPPGAQEEMQVWIEASRAGEYTRHAVVNVDVVDNLPLQADGQLFPSDGETDVTLRPQFVFSGQTRLTQSHLLEVATDPSFTELLISEVVVDPRWVENIFDTSFIPDFELPPSTKIYWRTTALNACGTGPASSVYSFTTRDLVVGECTAGYLPQVFFEDGMDSGDARWAHTADIGIDTWKIIERSGLGKVGTWQASSTAGVNDQSLSSQQFAIPPGASNPHLLFWNKRDNIQSGPGICYDGAILEYSTDNQASWSQIDNNRLLTDPYDDTVFSGADNPIEGQPAWCRDSVGKGLISSVDLGGLEGENLNLRFRLANDFSGYSSDDAWLIDDVIVQSCIAGTRPYPLKINSSGAAAVLINSSTGHDGTTNYSHSVAPGTAVSLLAPAVSGSSAFVSWTGCPQASGQTCSLTMPSQMRSVSANYQPLHQLLVRSSGANGVEIASASPNRGGTTNYSVAVIDRENFSLEAPPTHLDWQFTHWTGCTSTIDTVCNITMLSDYAVTAHYKPSTAGACGLGSVTTTHFIDHLEGTVGGWSHNATLGLDNWILDGADFNSPGNAWRSFGDGSQSDQRLVSPEMSIPADASIPTLEFYTRRNIADDPYPLCLNAAILEYSLNDGIDWVRFENERLLTDPYDAPIAFNVGNPLQSFWDNQAWCGNQDWQFSVIDLSHLKGQTVKFRFRLGTNDQDDVAGDWYIDDLVLQSCEPVQSDYELNVRSSGVSGVTINSISPYGGTTDYIKTVPAGENLTLEAPATVGAYSFSNWSGCTVTTSTSCSVTMSANTTVTANYTSAGTCPTGSTATTWLDDDMENVPLVGWWHFPDAGTPIETDTWELNELSAYSPTHAWHGLGIDTTSDQSLVSPTIALPATATNLVLSFQNKRDFESITASTCYDGAVLEYSTNLGVDWLPVASTSFLADPYNATITTAGNSLDGREAWCGLQDWTETKVNLASLAGQDIIFRFRIGTDLSVGRDGWHIDDVKVAGCMPDVVNYILQVNSSGASGVAITSSTGHDGITNYAKTVGAAGNVNLTAPATASGYTFSNWTGCTSTTTTSCSVTMSANTIVTANYAPPNCYSLTLGHTGSGTDPVALPANSTGCTTGNYLASESISLTASAAAGWTVSGWTGTSNDASTAATNQLTMPTGGHAVSVTYAVAGACPAGSTASTWLEEQRMESGEDGWTHSSIVGEDSWTLDESAANSPTHSWHGGFESTIDSVGDLFLRSPSVNVPAGATNVVLSFYNKRKFEVNGTFSWCYDGAVLEYTTNGGTDWLPVLSSRFLADAYNNYIGATSNPLFDETQDREAWCGPQDWTLTEVDLTGLVEGQTLGVRFRIGTDGSVWEDGWHIDDVEISGCDSSGSIFMNGFESQ